MTFREYFELLSLGLTPAVILLSAGVLLVWGGRAVKSVMKSERKELDWLILGITISFLGHIGDNTWWGIAWHHAATDSPLKDWWFENGVFSNSVFRQGCGIVAAICHMQAGMSSRRISGYVAVCAVIGIAYALTLALA